jgi:hypothetical protein
MRPGVPKRHTGWFLNQVEYCCEALIGTRTPPAGEWTTQYRQNAQFMRKFWTEPKHGPGLGPFSTLLRPALSARVKLAGVAHYQIDIRAFFSSTVRPVEGVIAREKARCRNVTSGPKTTPPGWFAIYLLALALISINRTLGRKV